MSSLSFSRGRKIHASLLRCGGSGQPDAGRAGRAVHHRRAQPRPDAFEQQAGVGGAGAQVTDDQGARQQRGRTPVGAGAVALGGRGPAARAPAPAAPASAGLTIIVPMTVAPAQPPGRRRQGTRPVHARSARSPAARPSRNTSKRCRQDPRANRSSAAGRPRQTISQPTKRGVARQLDPRGQLDVAALEHDRVLGQPLQPARCRPRAALGLAGRAPRLAAVHLGRRRAWSAARARPGRPGHRSAGRRRTPVPPADAAGRRDRRPDPPDRTPAAPPAAPGAGAGTAR